MSKLVYRIESIEGGKGPYTRIIEWGAESPYTDHRHPGPYSDRILKDVWSALAMEDFRDWYCFGFKDEEQLLRWFHLPEWYPTLRKAGFHLTVWEAQDKYAHYGDTQAVFRKDKANLIATRELYYETISNPALRPLY